MSEPTTPAWVADLPEDLRTNATIQSFKGNDWKEVGPVLAKSYVEARSVMGKKAYDLPQEDWKADQWAAWHKTIGVPESPDKYPAVDDALAAKAGLSKELLAGAFKRFHEVGMTPRQVKAVLNDWYVTEAAKGNELLATQKKDETARALETIKAEFGDKYEAKAGLVKSILQLGGGDLAQRLEDAGYGNDPQLFKALAALGDKIMEDTTAKGGKAVLGAGADREAALREIESIKADRIATPTIDAKYNDPRTAERARWEELHKKAYGKAAA